MGKLIKYKIGQLIGSLVYLKDIKVNKGNRKALFKCKCGNSFITFITSVKNGETTSCGCLVKTHGMSKHPLYKRHATMLDRCYKPPSHKYKRYGARGITVEPWLQNIHNYVSYIESLSNAYKEGYTIDRINNNGNYERGNLRWASAITQAHNKNNNSTYIGIHKNIANSYSANITFKRVDYYVGSFKTPEQAVFARNRFIVENDFPHPTQQIKLI